MPRRVNPDRVARFRRLGTALALVLVSGTPVLHGSAAKRELALKYYQDAVAQRLDIETVPEGKRTPELYQKAIQAFRRVYRTSPQSSKADDSLLAIADIYARMGERFGAAPGAATYQVKAVQAYEFLIHEYPYSSLLDQARKKADALKQQIAATADKPAAIDAATAVEKPSPAPSAELAADRQAERVMPRSEPPPAPAKPGQAPSEIADVRHWSFPDFTRVVINLEAEPKVQAERLTEPDRIYFDLPNTKLGGDRKFRTVAVNDALVKRIRMAQTQASVTRVVIDLNADVQQSTSVLTNPTRLVVELRKWAAAQPAVASATNPEPVPPAKQTGQPEGSRSRAAAEQPAVAAVKSSALKAGENKLGENPAGSAAATKSIQSKPADSTVVAGSTPKLPPTAAATAPVEAATAKHPAVPFPAPSPAAVSAKTATSSILPPADTDNSAAIPPRPAKSISSGNSGSESNSEPRSDENPASPLPQRATSTKSSGSKRAAAPAPTPAAKATASVTDAAAVEPVLTAAVTAEPKPALPIAAPTAAPKSVRQKTVDSSKASGSSKTGDSSTEVASLPKMAAPKAADPTSRGERDLVRALGLKVSRVVIDAGHGGHDTGTIGPTGLLEKDLTLDVATRLGELIADRIGSEIVYTRSDDTFIPLGERTAMANEKGADLFISVHANSSRVRAVRGIETYYLNLTGDREALATAARENASSEKTIHELQDLVSKITLTEKISESREFASQVQHSLFTAVSRENATLRNRGVRTAPFVVLIGARMPSVLAEISFISNPRDEKLLKTPAYRQKIAEALYKGVAGYAGGLSSVEVAKK